MRALKICAWLCFACCALPAIGRAQSAEVTSDGSHGIVLRIDPSDASTRSAAHRVPPAPASEERCTNCLDILGWTFFGVGVLVDTLGTFLTALADPWLADQLGYTLPWFLPVAGPAIQLVAADNRPPGYDMTPIIVATIGAGMELLGLLFALLGAAIPDPPPAAPTPAASDENQEPGAQTPAPRVNVLPSGGPSDGSITLRIQWQ